MTPRDLISTARGLSTLIPPGPASLFAQIGLGLLEEILDTGAEWRRTAALVHDVVRGYRVADAAGREAMHARWREHARAAVAARPEASADVQDALYGDGEPEGG